MLLFELLGDESELIQESAMDALSRMAPDRVRPLLVQALAGGDPDARVRAAHAAGEADELDGLTVSYPDWWFNLRPSNTEPLLRLNLEAASDAEVAAKRDALLALIEG